MIEIAITYDASTRLMEATSALIDGKIIGGTVGDSNATRITFTITGDIAGYTPYCAIGAKIVRNGKTVVNPEYLLDENRQVILPGEVMTSSLHGKIPIQLHFRGTISGTVGGETVTYNSEYFSENQIIIELMPVIDNPQTSEIEPPTIDELWKKAFVNVSYTNSIITLTSYDNSIKTVDLTGKQDKLTGGASGQILATDGSGNVYWKDDAEREIVTEWSQTLSDEKVPSEKLVKNSLPTKTSDLANDSGFLTEHQSLSAYSTTAQMNTAISNYHDSTKYDASNPDGYTDNIGTITEITMNGASKGTSGNVDLGTVITSHQDISGKQDKSNLVTSINSGSTNTTYPATAAVRDFVNSSIATETAYFRGTYPYLKKGEGQSENGLLDIAWQDSDPTATGTYVTNNDYAFAIGVDAYGNTAYNRYKWTHGETRVIEGITTSWLFEYSLNNSSFTQEQWASISSGINSTKVSSYDAHINNTSNPHSVTKAQVGLENVDNTADIDKPASNPTRALVNTRVSKTGAETISGAKTFTSTIIGSISGNAATATALTSAGEATLLAKIYPVGSVYINASDSTNPNTLLGFGTWLSLGAGRCLVGVDTNDSSFNTVGRTGGEKTHTLSANEMPSHTHTQNAHSHTASSDTTGSHYHTIEHSTIYLKRRGFNTGSGAKAFVDKDQNPDESGVVYDSGVSHNHGCLSTGSHSHTISVNNATATNQYTGGSGAHNNLQPYITVYMWKRTA